MIIPSNPFSVH
uniref:Uncharacterized protein n=1 Tax=Rhizophora mucronata TaxID=61149 RepID=A0A2P2MYR5_RHIMU